MERRSKSIEGFVNFPVNELDSTEEGGQVVKLVVIDPMHAVMAKFSGSYVFELTNSARIMVFPFVGDDKHDMPELTKESANQDIADYMARVGEWEERHFVNINNRSDDSIERDMSVGYRTAIVMGTTGWSNGCWQARYDDLNEDGKALYQMVQKLNPGCNLHLLTFIDT